MATVAQAWGGELPEFASSDEVEEVMRVLVQGPWNRLSEHQSTRNPFRLPRFEVTLTRQALHDLALVRAQELKGFVYGLFGAEEEMLLPQKAHEAVEALAELHAMFDGAAVLLADELRRWSSNPEKDRVELFRRMVFNAMVTNNDDHPRNHALLQVDGGWRLSPAYDIAPVPATSKERRDLALDVGKFGRAASIYNLLSQPEVFGLSLNAARAEIDRMRQKVSGWQGLFKHHGVSATDIEKIAPAMLPESFEPTAPLDPV